MICSFLQHVLLQYPGCSKPHLGYIARVILASIIALLAAHPAYAQRELRIKKLEEGPLPYVATFVAPAARNAIVNDVAKVLAVGHRPKHPSHVSIYRLDDQGQVVAGDPVPLTLPKPAPLADIPTEVIGLVAHPTLPLLYVWQDVAPPPDPMVLDPARSVEFDHLCVYSLDENPPKLIFAAARGTDFHTGAIRGGFTYYAPSRRLFVPNMQLPASPPKPKTDFVGAVGWLKMSPDGLPLFVDPAVKPAEGAPTSTPVPPALDPAAAAASRAARIAQWDQAKAAGKPLALDRYAETAEYAFNYWPLPDSYCPFNDDVILTATHSGVANWMLKDQGGRYGYFFVSQIPYRHRMAIHPTHQAGYVNLVGYDGRLIRIEHADGYWTGTPQYLTIDNAVAYSPPVVLPKSNQVVMGCANRVVAVTLAPNGNLTTQGIGMTVNNPTVEAIAWSERFGKLYVAVEKTP